MKNVGVEGIAMERRATLGHVTGYFRLRYRSYSPFCDPCFLSLFRLEKHRSQKL